MMKPNMPSARRGRISRRTVGSAFATLALWSLTVSAAPPGPNLPNVWILGADGAPIASYQLAGPGLSSDSQDVGGALAVLVDGVWTLVPGVTSNDAIVVNRVAGSWPGSNAAGLPSVAVAGITGPSHNAAQPTAPGLSVSPQDGVFEVTTRVVIETQPALGQNGLIYLRYRINGGKTVYVPPSVARAEFWLMDAGTYSIAATAYQKDNTGKWRVTSTTRTIELAPQGGKHRDSDGDGVPDRVEIEWGTDPMEADAGGSDRDGDGWSDLDERLRGSDPSDPSSSPKDDDGDGWSNWDESLRGTDPYDGNDMPTARRLTEVEYTLTGSVDFDGPYAPLGTIALWGAVSPDGPLAEFQAQSLTAFGPVRVPAGESIVVSALPKAGQDPGEEWDALSWMPPQEDITVERLADLVAAGKPTWSHGDEWLAALEAEAAEQLVQPHKVTLSQWSTIPVVLVETVVGWYAGLTGDAPCRFTTPVDPACIAAAKQLESSGSASDFGLTELYDTLETHIANGGATDTKAQMLGAYDAVGTGSLSSTVSHALSVAWQLAPSGSAIRYEARLVAQSGDQLASLPPTEQATALDPDADADGDGVPNAWEQGPSHATATNPLAWDTDEDGLSDKTDPCPLDPAQACLTQQASAADSDGDGVLDPVDSCIDEPNADQADSNGDGIGDACNVAARVASPTVHPVIMEGDSLNFTAVENADVYIKAYVLWYVDGKYQSSSKTPPAFEFDTPGTHTVLLRCRQPGQWYQTCDSRTVQVLPK